MCPGLEAGAGGVAIVGIEVEADDVEFDVDALVREGLDGGFHVAVVGLLAVGDEDDGLGTCGGSYVAGDLEQRVGDRGEGEGLRLDAGDDAASRGAV